jgi:hypothetical protein
MDDPRNHTNKHGNEVLFHVISWIVAALLRTAGSAGFDLF